MTTTTATEHETLVRDRDNNESDSKKMSTKTRHCFETPIKWVNVIAMSLLHVGAFYGAYLMLAKAKYATIFFWWTYCSFASQGITAGSHRLWAHSSYRARLPLRIFLAIANLISFQNDIYTWSRDHRVHHKFSDTDADPHNSQRGFFFSHMGWLLCKKHPEVRRKGATIDCKDLLNDPVVYWQRKFYLPLMIFFCFYLPTMLPVWWWNETIEIAFYVSLFRYVYQLHNTWMVNSVAHMYGMQTYDRSIPPRESSLVVFATYGEGYHNYHHTWPQDYSASELGFKLNWNPTTMFIDFCALIGQAYDLKKPPETLVKNRIERTGKTDEHDKMIDNRRRYFVLNTITELIIGLSHLWIPLGIRFMVMKLQS